MTANLDLNHPRVPGEADLAFGAAPAPTQTSLATADIVLPEIAVDALLRSIVKAASDAPLPEITIDSAASYLVNVWRGPQHSAAAAHQDGARLERETAGPWREPIRIKPRMGDIWQTAARLPAETGAGWASLTRRHTSPAVAFAQARALFEEASDGWSYPLRQRDERGLPWGLARRGYLERRAPFRYPPRQQASPATPWQVAQPASDILGLPWNGHPAKRRFEKRIPWEDAFGVISLWPRPDHWTPPPTPPRIVTPDIDFICLRVPGDSALRFMVGCYREPLAIPIQRAYIVIHDIELVRLADGIPIHASRIGIELDADSWAWGFSATLLGKDALEAVLPSALGEPVILAASIDGHTWHFMVEDWTESREFGKRGVSVKGRGLSADLAVPYALPGSGVTASDMTVQQVLNAHLPIGAGWSIAWAMGTPDWLVPAGAWSWSGKAPIQAIHEAATGAGLVVIPAKAGRVLTLQPRYPVLPWALATHAPDLTIPDAAIRATQRQQAIATQANAVYVHGGDTGGQLARVKRVGTAGDRVAPVQSSPLMTHADALRLLGSRILAAHHRQPEVRSITTTLGGPFPLGEIGQHLRATVEGVDHDGIINAVSLEASMTDTITVRQTLTIGETTPNSWARFKRLLPDDPLLLGTIESTHADGTATVLMLGGGTLRVRGSGTAGQAVYVRAGRIEGTAPTLAQLDIEV